VSELGIFDWLFMLFLILALCGINKIADFLRDLGGGGRGDGPSYPLPITSPVETSRGSAKPKE
jgi:hypothetical protein